MRKFIFGVLLLIGTLFSILPGVSSADDRGTYESHRMQMFEKILPSTFMITVFVGVPYPLLPEFADKEQRYHFELKDSKGKMYRFVQVIIGSGCHTFSDDYILTVKHLTSPSIEVMKVARDYGIVKMDTLSVVYSVTDSRLNTFTTDVFAEDEKEDLALLRVKPKNVSAIGPAVPLSSRGVERYEGVFTIGTPDGVPFTVTDGYVNTLHVSLPPPLGELVQLTLPIAHGNSGGCVFRMSTGEVVGMVIAQRYSAPHVSYSVSLEAIWKFLHSKLPKTAAAAADNKPK